MIKNLLVLCLMGSSEVLSSNPWRRYRGLSPKDHSCTQDRLDSEKHSASNEVKLNIYFGFGPDVPELSQSSQKKLATLTLAGDSKNMMLLDDSPKYLGKPERTAEFDIVKGRMISTNPNKHSRLSEKRAFKDNQLSLDWVKRLNEVDDIDEFLEEYFDTAEPEITVGNRFGDDDTPRKTGPRGGNKVPTAKMANCIPEMTVVELNPPGPHAPGVIHMPKCTRVPRCGGCCLHDNLSCQAKEVKSVTLKVYQLVHSRRNVRSPQMSKFVNVTVDEHVTCQCDCIIKASDCSDSQLYFPDSCSCMCPDQEAIKECLQVGRSWDEATCTCVCPRETDCTTGSYFDQETCTCMK